MSECSNRNEWIFGSISKIIDDKEAMVNDLVIRMLGKTIKAFKYTNLPDTIKAKDLETILQVGGYAILKVVDDKPYAFGGGLGGMPNPYYLPTKAIIANPALKYNATLDIDEDCVVMLNDFYYQGMMPLHSKYARLLAEAEITLKYAIRNARVPAIIQADNDNTMTRALDFFNTIIEGKDYGVVGSKEFFEGIKSHDFYKQSYIKETIESIQYIKGSWYNEVGLNAAFNMKREAINEAEATLNEDILVPLLDEMLECRQTGIDKFNKMFGYNIGVEFGSIWETNRRRDELEVDILENEAEENDNVEEGKDNNETD